MRLARSMVPFLAFLIVASPVLTPAARATTMAWNLADDFSLSPDQANPNPDQYGNADVWYFMEGRAQDTSSYSLLPGFVSDAFDVANLEQWPGRVDPWDPN